MYLNEEARNKIFADGDLNDIEFNFHGSFIGPINENIENRYNFYARLNSVFWRQVERTFK